MLSALPSRILHFLAFLLVYITHFIYFSLSLLYSVLSVLYLLRRLFPLVYILRLGIYPPYKSPPSLRVAGGGSWKADSGP